MDEDIPYSYTDCDYCFRLRDIGFETWVSAGAIAYHKGGTDPNNSKICFQLLSSGRKRYVWNERLYKDCL